MITLEIGKDSRKNLPRIFHRFNAMLSLSADELGVFFHIGFLEFSENTAYGVFIQVAVGVNLKCQLIPFDSAKDRLIEKIIGVVGAGEVAILAWNFVARNAFCLWVQC